MKKNKTKKRSGNLILDRYMPDANEEERKEAERRLSAFALALARIDIRLQQEESDAKTQSEKNQ